MVAPESQRRSELASDNLRRFIRRGARANITRLLAKTRPEDVAQLIRRMTPSEQVTVYRILVTEFPDSAGEVLRELEEPIQQDLLEDLSSQEIEQVLVSMPVDDAVDVVESLPDELEERVLEIVDDRHLEEVQQHLTYGDESAGRLMVPSFVALAASLTVEEAIAAIRRTEDLDNVFYLYVVDEDERLVGVVSLRQLLLARSASTLGEVMTRSVVKVGVETDQEEVAELVARYNLLAIPVTDEEGRLAGIVTVDDVMDVVNEEATEDIFKMVGTSDVELVYQDRSLRVAGFRLPWLLVNLAGLIVAGVLLKYFQVTLKEALFLVFFLPVVMGMGGNVGSQTATIAVRGLATGRIGQTRNDLRRFIWQQLKVGAILAVACALAVALGAVALEKNASYALVVSASLFLVVVLASVNGACIPLIFHKLGIDPAVASSPLVTTSNDITGILIYFGIAYLLIDLLIR